MSIITSTSLLISSSVEFIKNGHDSFSVALDKTGYIKSRDNLTLEYINQFNRNCANGTIDKLINGCIKSNITSTSESATRINEDGIFIDYDENGEEKPVTGSFLLSRASSENNFTIWDEIARFKM